jgi:hypothetical protein
VRPPSPGATPLRAKTIDPNSASPATSNVYDNGRTPLVDAFSTSSRIGCCDSLNLKPCCGSSRRGWVISTPGIGPATPGLSGFALFLASQAKLKLRSRAENARSDVRFTRLMVIHLVPTRPTGKTRQHR